LRARWRDWRDKVVYQVLKALVFGALAWMAHDHLRGLERAEDAERAPSCLPTTRFSAARARRAAPEPN
jgi:hypothetical protein